MFIFNSDLTRQLRSWPLTRYVKSLAWSPDGKRLAVLYDGRFDKDRNYVGELPQSKWPTSLPDIEAFDPMAGAALIQCTSGHPESQIVFSPDGSVIYAISQQSVAGPMRGDGVRAFSSISGKLVRVIAPNRPRLHDEFALSPDGRFIAADASSELGHPFWTEPVAFSNVSRVVVLDSKTGKVLFSRERKTGTAAPLNPIFTPDGRLLIVQYGPYLSAKGKQRATIHIVAYSLPSG
jgi:WD40 repeat protein